MLILDELVTFNPTLSSVPSISLYILFPITFLISFYPITFLISFYPIPCVISFYLIPFVISFWPIIIWPSDKIGTTISQPQATVLEYEWVYESRGRNGLHYKLGLKSCVGWRMDLPNPYGRQSNFLRGGKLFGYAGNVEGDASDWKCFDYRGFHRHENVPQGYLWPAWLILGY